MSFPGSVDLVQCLHCEQKTVAVVRVETETWPCLVVPLCQRHMDEVQMVLFAARKRETR